MLWEALAALLLGLTVLWLVLEPMLRGLTPAPPVPEPVDPAETPQGVALAALKEIEFDRATGKLSDEDYRTLMAKYTGEALALLRETEAGGTATVPAGAAPAAVPGAAPAGADDVEALISARVRTLRSAEGSPPPVAAACPVCGPRPEPDAVFCSSCGRAVGTAGCSRCGAELAPGSLFCESCGARVAA